MANAGTRVIGLLVNQADTALAQAQLPAIQSAANTLGLELQVLNASGEHDFDAAFANLIGLRAGGLVISRSRLYSRHGTVTTIASVTVLGALQASPAVKTALAERLR
jgi:DNA-binding LacI/PurR family transcriptional regulator